MLIIHLAPRKTKERSSGSRGSCYSRRKTWQPYYASQWTDAQDVFNYVSQNYPELKKRTQTFHDALFDTTLPAYVSKRSQRIRQYSNRLLSCANTTGICGVGRAVIRIGVAVRLLYTCLELRPIARPSLPCPGANLTRAGVASLDGQRWPY